MSPEKWKFGIQCYTYSVSWNENSRVSTQQLCWVPAFDYDEKTGLAIPPSSPLENWTTFMKQTNKNQYSVTVGKE